MYLLLLLSTKLFGQDFRTIDCYTPNVETYSLSVATGKLIYVAGVDSICNIRVSGLATWDTIRWNTLGAPMDFVNYAGTFKVFINYKNKLYGAGNFIRLNDYVRLGIAVWNGLTWDTVGLGVTKPNSINRTINALEIYQNELYAAGYFTEIDGKPAQSIAKWDGVKWTIIPGVQSSFTQVNCMTVYKNELYVGGHFWTAGGKPANFIARWNGIEWNSLGTGVNSQVTSMVVDTIRNLLYVGGYFGGVNDTLKGRVMMWDGFRWHQLGSNNNYLSFQPVAVTSLEYYNGYIYAGGLSHKGVATDTVFTRWNGHKWEPILGINNGITHLKYFKGKLYLGGFFTKINNDTLPYLASYYSPDSVTVGVNTNKESSKKTIKIFPNPSKDLLQIESQIRINSYKITDLNGRVIQEEKIDKKQNANTTYSISINKLIKGIYFIHVFDETQRNIGTEKFIIE